MAAGLCNCQKVVPEQRREGRLCVHDTRAYCHKENSNLQLTEDLSLSVLSRKKGTEPEGNRAGRSVTKTQTSNKAAAEPHST